MPAWLVTTLTDGRQGGSFCPGNGVKQLILTHISGRYRERDIEDEARRFFPNSTVARDFDAFKIRNEDGKDV